MKKRISDLTDEEIYKYLYGNIKCAIDYMDRECYPEDNNVPARNITYDNCRYCKEHQITVMCGLECHQDKSVIDYQAVRTGIYKDDEIEVEE